MGGNLLRSALNDNRFEVRRGKVGQLSAHVTVTLGSMTP
jgi:hypothetical protein